MPQTPPVLRPHLYLWWVLCWESKLCVEMYMLWGLSGGLGRQGFPQAPQSCSPFPEAFSGPASSPKLYQTSISPLSVRTSMMVWPRKSSDSRFSRCFTRDLMSSSSSHTRTLMRSEELWHSLQESGRFCYGRTGSPLSRDSRFLPKALPAALGADREGVRGRWYSSPQ